MTFLVSYAAIFDQKTLRSIDQSMLRNIKHAIEKKLATAPETFGKPLQKSLHGLWVLRVQDYRIVYRMREKNVEIYAIRHRSTMYDWLRERFER